MQVTLPQLLPGDRGRRAARVHVQLRRLHHRVLHERPGPDRADLPVRLDPARRQPRGQRDRHGPAHRDDPGDDHGRGRVPARASDGRAVGDRGRATRPWPAWRWRPRREPPTGPRDRHAPSPGRCWPTSSATACVGPSSPAATSPDRSCPTRTLLADRFAVSRATIREAVRGLVEEGYLVRRQGSGTFVTARPLLRNSLDRTSVHLVSRVDRGARRAPDPRHPDGPADEAVAEQLLVEPGESVVELPPSPDGRRSTGGLLGRSDAGRHRR